MLKKLPEKTYNSVDELKPWIPKVKEVAGKLKLCMVSLNSINIEIRRTVPEIGEKVFKTKRMEMSPANSLFFGTYFLSRILLLTKVQ
jgi:hypothetical protein